MTAARLIRLTPIVCLAALAWTAAVTAQTSPPVFTAAQATSGRAVYAERCAACHLDDLGGNGDAPPVAGEGFIAGWKQKTTSDLLQYLKGMPPGGPALSEAEYLTVAAYLLEQNGAATGETPLTTSTNVMLGTIASGRRPPR